MRGYRFETRKVEKFAVLIYKDLKCIEWFNPQFIFQKTIYKSYVMIYMLCTI